MIIATDVTATATLTEEDAMQHDQHVTDFWTMMEEGAAARQAEADRADYYDAVERGAPPATPRVKDSWTWG